MPALNIDRADFLKQEDIVIFEHSVARFLDEHAPRIPGGEVARSGNRRARRLARGGRSRSALPRRPRGLRRRRRRLPPRGRADGGRWPEAGQRVRRLAAQRDRRALHPPLRLGGAEEALAAEDGLRRIHRRHRDVRAGAGSDLQGVKTTRGSTATTMSSTGRRPSSATASSPTSSSSSPRPTRRAAPKAPR